MILHTDQVQIVELGCLNVKSSSDRICQRPDVADSTDKCPRAKVHGRLFCQPSHHGLSDKHRYCSNSLRTNAFHMIVASRDFRAHDDNWHFG